MAVEKDEVTIQDSIIHPSFLFSLGRCFFFTYFFQTYDFSHSFRNITDSLIYPYYVKKIIVFITLYTNGYLCPKTP